MRRTFAAVVIGASLGCSTGTLPSEIPVGGDFTLTNQDGQSFASTSLRGKVALVSFGYTFCPDRAPRPCRS